MAKRAKPLKSIKAIIKQAGGPSKVAEAFGIRPASVCGWSRVPAERLAKVSELTGIPIGELRPDLAAIFEAA